MVETTVIRRGSLRGERFFLLFAVFFEVFESSEDDSAFIIANILSLGFSALVDGMASIDGAYSFAVSLHDSTDLTFLSGEGK